MKQFSEIKMFDQDEAMDAAYDVFTGRASVFDVIEQAEHVIVFPFDPTHIGPEEIKQMEFHYARMEDYERAIILRDWYEKS
jgi:uncharacterized protein YciU (UPF0263 family)